MTTKQINDTDDVLLLYNEINLIHTQNANIFRHLEEYKDAKYSNINKKEELNINLNNVKLIETKIDMLNKEILRLNHNFRLLSKVILSDIQYAEIYQLSKLKLSDSKETLSNQLKLKYD